jgi:cephalosporin hydroxylase
VSESNAGRPSESHGDVVPGSDEFLRMRAEWRDSMADDAVLRQEAVDLQRHAEVHRYTYTWDWLGVPIIRIPDDVVVLQELFWSYRPQRVVETGIARGGSMLLDASLMKLCGQEPAVLGIDWKIFPHTIDSLRGHPLMEGVELLEANSASGESESAVKSFIGEADRAVLILDSNHTHEHVLAELDLLAPLLPGGGIVLVADTLIEEFPLGYYKDRPWDRGNNPATAVREFLFKHTDFHRSTEWSRRALLSEFRDGIICRDW